MNLLTHHSADLRERITGHDAGDDADRADGSCHAAPKWLALGINNFCNLRCRMCGVGGHGGESVFYAHLIGSDRRNMSLQLLHTILEQAGGFSPRPKVG